MATIVISMPDGSEKKLDLGVDTIRVGRDNENEIRIVDDSVSTFHAEIRAEGGAHHVHDLGSTNGIRVNGERVSESVIADGDLLRFGNIRASYAGNPSSDVQATGSPQESHLPPEAPVREAAQEGADQGHQGGSSLGPLAPGAALPGFGPKTVVKDPEKTLFILVSVVVALLCVAAAILSFTMAAN